MPHERDDRLVLPLSDHGAPKIERRGSEPPAIDWVEIGRAVEKVCRLAAEAVKGRTTHVYVAGQGPLPIFIHLGFVISKFAGPQWVIARKLDGAGWEALSLADGTTGP